MVFVTGGTGLVGARLIFDLIEKGEKITALIRPNTPKSKFSSLIKFYNTENKAFEEQVNWVVGDLLDLEKLIEIIPEGSKVYHCAAMVSFNPKNNHNIFETNVDGTANLVNACLLKKVVKFCHVSSIGALGGKIIGQKIDEETPWSTTGKSAYSISKHNSELEVWRGIAEGLNAVVVNPAVILGPGDWNQGSPQLFKMISSGQKYYTLGTTSYIDVRDVTRAMIMLMDSEIQDERFLLASQTISFQNIFTEIAQSIHVKAPYKKATKFITGMAYRVDKVRSVILRKEPRMTKQTHKIAHAFDDYSGTKICDRLNFSYTPIANTIQFIGSCFLQTNK